MMGVIPPPAAEPPRKVLMVVAKVEAVVTGTHTPRLEVQPVSFTRAHGPLHRGSRGVQRLGGGGVVVDHVGHVPLVGGAVV